MSMTNLLVSITLLLGAHGLGYMVYRTVRKRRRKEQQKDSNWSIGYQISTSPLEINPETASVYSADQLPLGTAGIADPFLLEQGGIIYLFYELILKSEPAAKIAVSVYDPDNKSWNFHSVVLDEPFHLSYPYIFEHDSETYMIPESKEAQSVRLYRSVGFPSKWQFERTLIQNKKYVDSSIIYWEGHFFLFTTRKRKLHLYYSESLTGAWYLHPSAPVKRWNYARCAGRIFEHNGKLFRFAQEQAKGYGMGVRLYEILELSSKGYKETAVDQDLFLQPFGDDWAQHGMHHVDIIRLADDSYLSVFDGRGIIRKPQRDIR
jgi:hypothetical protein